MAPPHPHHPAPHPHRPRPGPHAGRWLHNSEGDLTREQVASLLTRLAAGVTEHGAVELGDLHVALPPSVYSVVRHELSPHAERVVRVELRWADDVDAAPLSPIAALLP